MPAPYDAQSMAKRSNIQKVAARHIDDGGDILPFMTPIINGSSLAKLDFLSNSE